MPPPPAPQQGTRAGILFALSAYIAWGAVPVLFYLLRAASPVEIVAWRVVLSLIFCVLIITIIRGWRRLITLFRDRRTVAMLGVASVFIIANWLIYVYAATTGQMIEASLGYFANPILTVLLGVFLLKERLRPLQWVSVGIGAIAVVVMAIGSGSFPWIAMGLALSFGFYGYAKNRVGPRADAVSGLAVETALLTPPAMVALVVLGATTGLTIGALGSAHLILMLSVGFATATPLMLFAAAARRLPLVQIGLLQYINPAIQLIIGIILQEPMPPQRWLAFGIVWLALLVLTVDMLRNSGRQRALAAAVEAGP